MPPRPAAPPPPAIAAPLRTPPAGLTDAEAAARAARGEGNAFRPPTSRTYVEILRQNAYPGINGILIGVSVLLVLFGLRVEAFLTAGPVLANILIGVVQEARAKRKLDRIALLNRPRARVVRAGVEREVDPADVVVGDLLVARRGDQVLLDGTVVGEGRAEVDESLLSGESDPVGKVAGDPALSGSAVVSGTLVIEVERVGAASFANRLLAEARRLGDERTPLQREIAATIWAVAGLVLVAALPVAFALHALPGGFDSRETLAAAAVLVTLVPQGLAIMVTVTYAAGALRITRLGALVQRQNAVESMARVDTLCVDKTGTLTLNQMAIHSLVTREGEFPQTGPAPRPLDPAARTVLDRGVLASDPHPYDPMDQAFHRLGEANGLPPPDRRTGARILRRYPLRRDFLAVCQAWSGATEGEALLAAKGAPETLFDLCGMTGAERAYWEGIVSKYAQQGHRLLGVAEDPCPMDSIPEDPKEHRFHFLGLAALEDPLRPEVPEAVRSCQKAGIRVIMITGDYPLTAARIAKDAGLDPGEIITGKEIEESSPDELSRRLERTNVCARVTPDQKLTIVRALQRAGEIVAMTGDGVNDAPALKASNVGVAMGRRGTDVAREAADVVLLADSFPSMVGAIRAGRRIVDNLRKAVSFLFSVHVPIIGLVLLPVLMNLPLLLFPVHIVVLEFLIDPAVSVGFEAEPADPGVMERPPRDPDAPIFDRGLIVRSLIEGGIVLAGSFLLFLFTIDSGYAEPVARSLAFTSLVVASLTLMFVNRRADPSSDHQRRLANRNMQLMVLLVTAVLAVGLFVPPVAAVFHFGVTPLPELGAAIAIGLLTGGWREVQRRLWPSRPSPPAPLRGTRRTGG